MNLLDIFNNWLKEEQPKGVVDTTKGVVQNAPEYVDDYYDRVAFVESSNNPKAKSKTSSAAGLFQFTEDTWNEYVKKMGKRYSLDDRFDPNKALEVMKFKTQDISNRLKQTLKRDPNHTEKYMAHFMGVSGARKFLQASPFDPVDKVATPAQLKANRSVFFDKDGNPKTVLEVFEFFEDKLRKAK